MTWFKVDDLFWSSPKVNDLESGPCFGEAIALWTLTGSWCASQLADGYVSEATLRKVVPFAWSQAASELVRVRLWDRVDAGYQFHNWGKYQPTKERVESERAAGAGRLARWREKNKKPGNAVGNAVTDPFVTPFVTPTHGNGNPDPTRPDPTRPVQSREAPVAGLKVRKPKPPSRHELAMADERVTRILTFYRTTHSLPDRWKAESSEGHYTRAEHILRALTGEGGDQLTEAEITAAIRGNAANPWHKERGKHELSYLLRCVKTRQFIAEAKTAPAPAPDLRAVEMAIADAERALQAAHDPPDGVYRPEVVEAAQRARQALGKQRNQLLGICG